MRTIAQKGASQYPMSAGEGEGGGEREEGRGGSVWGRTEDIYERLVEASCADDGNRDEPGGRDSDVSYARPHEVKQKAK